MTRIATIFAILIFSFSGYGQSNQLIKIEIQIVSSDAEANTEKVVVGFSINQGNDDGISFWKGKQRQFNDTLTINGKMQFYYVNPNSYLNLQIPQNIRIDLIRIKFYNMNESVVSERSKWVILMPSDIDLLFQSRQRSEQNTLHCKIILNDLFYFQVSKTPYKRNKDFLSFQIEFSDYDSFERGIFISVFDHSGNSYKMYKYFSPDYHDSDMYTFEFYKPGKKFDQFEINIQPFNQLDTVLIIEGISVTNDIRTQDLNNFTIRSQGDTSQSIIDSYPVKLSLNKEASGGSNSKYLIIINELGISYSMIRNMKVFTFIVIFSILLFFGNRSFLKSDNIKISISQY